MEVDVLPSMELVCCFRGSPVEVIAETSIYFYGRFHAFSYTGASIHFHLFPRACIYFHGSFQCTSRDVGGSPRKLHLRPWKHGSYHCLRLRNQVLWKTLPWCFHGSFAVGCSWWLSWCHHNDSMVWCFYGALELWATCEILRHGRGCSHVRPSPWSNARQANTSTLCKDRMYENKNDKRANDKMI